MKKNSYILRAFSSLPRIKLLLCLKEKEKNVGETDKKIRIILGVISIFLATQIGAWPRWVLLILGVALILTGLFQFCCLYTLFGINTCERKIKN